MNTVCYVGQFAFPLGNAAGLRVLGIGKALREAGYRVTFVGSEREGRREDLQPDGRYVYEGFRYLPESKATGIVPHQVKRLCLTHLTGITTIRRLRAIDLPEKSAVIAYGGPALLLWRLESECRRRRVALVADCTEWYDPGNVPLGPLGPFYWDSELRMRWLVPRIGRAIVVSSYLERHFRQHGCRVLRVPPLVDTLDASGGQAEHVHPAAGVLRLVYAGSPGRKDLIGNAIRGLRMLRSRGACIKFHLVGVDPRQASSLLGRNASLIGELHDAIVWHGRVDQPTSARIVARADFSVLLRADKRYAHAGFPTKLVESLAVGVPIITNVTSDIGEYVRDGREGIHLKDSSPEAFAEGVSRALDMSSPDRMAMRAAARARARECFDYRQHSALLANFVGEAIQDSGN